MREVSIDELRQLAEAAREDIWEAAREHGREPKVYLHWSAGHHFQKFDDYHVNITGDGKIYVSTDNLADVLAHTYYRNSGSVGISLCAAQALRRLTSAMSRLRRSRLRQSPKLLAQ